MSFGVFFYMHCPGQKQNSFTRPCFSYIKEVQMNRFPLLKNYILKEKKWL